MKRLSLPAMALLLAMFASFSAIGQQQATPGRDVMTNDSVIELVTLGLGEAVIIQKIRQSERRFDTSNTGLAQLKGAKVSDNIIMEMMNAGSGSVAPAGSNMNGGGSGPVEAGNPNDPMAPHEPGIYIVQNKQVLEINPAVFKSASSSWWKTWVDPTGIWKSRTKGTLRGASANTIASDPRPEFYFYFDKSLSNPGYVMSGFLQFGASSPNEFVLVRMEQKKGAREAVIGEFNAYGSSTGTRDKDIVDFTFVKIRPGVFKVVPKDDLPPGEYGFYYAGTPVGLGFAGGKIFDFSVSRAM